MSVSHVYFYLFQIIFNFHCSSSAVLNIITQDSERLLDWSLPKGYLYCEGDAICPAFFEENPLPISGNFDAFFGNFSVS